MNGGVERDSNEGSVSAQASAPKQKRRGWREVEAWRERKFLRECLAEIWEDDPCIDESVFSSAESDAEFYTNSEEFEVEDEDDFADDYDEDFDDEAFYDEED